MRGRLQGVFIVVVAGGPRIADVVARGERAALVGTAAAAAGGGVLVVVGTVRRRARRAGVRALPDQPRGARGRLRRRRAGQAPSRPRTYAAWPRCWASSLTTLTSRTPRVTGGSHRSSTTRSRSSGVEPLEVPEGLLVHGGEVRREPLGVDAHVRDLLAGVAVADVAEASKGRPNLSWNPCAVHTCSSPATSATWSSWTRVRCQTSHADRVGVGAGPVGQLRPRRGRRRRRGPLPRSVRRRRPAARRESCSERRSGTGRVQPTSPARPRVRRRYRRDELRLHPDDRAERAARAGRATRSAPRRRASTSR